jgi:hypothetical protein
MEASRMNKQACRTLPAFAALLLLPLAASAAPHVALPQDFPANMIVLQGKRVMNRIGKKPLLIPPYLVTEFHAGAVHSHQSERGGLEGAVGGSTISVGSTESKARAEQDYGFRLEEAGQAAWAGKCRMTADSSSSSSGIVVTSGDVDDLDIDRVAVQCELREEGSGDAWQLDLRSAMHPFKSEGALTRGASSFQVTSTEAVEGWKKMKLPVPSGFLFSRDGRWRAAADWWRPSALRFDPALDNGERRLLAAASAALLLSNSLRMPGA